MNNNRKSLWGIKVFFLVAALLGTFTITQADPVKSDNIEFVTSDNLEFATRAPETDDFLLSVEEKETIAENTQKQSPSTSPGQKAELPDLPDFLAQNYKVTFSTVYNDVKAGLAGLASSLKVGVEHVYKVLVRQQYVKAITYSLLSLIGLIGIMYAINTGIKTASLDKDDRKNNNLIGFGWLRTVVIGVMSIVLFICGAIYLDQIVTGFVNPEYGAIKEIIDFVK
jgi:hypothetical protein